MIQFLIDQEMKRANTTHTTETTSKHRKAQLGSHSNTGRHKTDERCKQPSFGVSPISKYDTKFPYFREPVEIGNFSLDGQRKFHNDNRQLRYYTPPKSKHVNFDLRAGYGTSILRDESVKERLDHLLMWINLNRKKFQVAADNGESESKRLVLLKKCLNNLFMIGKF